MSFTSQTKALILLLTDTQAQLLSWQRTALAVVGTYRNPPGELDDFSAALRRYAGWPVIIMADVIEESFRHDTVVHVGGSDRTALLKRKLDFAFRGTPYRLGKVTGRATQGRRDDSILLSALTKPELLSPWISALLAQKFAIQSLTSVAHLLQAFAAAEKLEKEACLLLINLEEGNNLRQTFIKEGQVLFSRLTTLATRELTLLGTDIFQETQQIRQYFERIEFIAYDAPLRIRVYAAHADELLQLEARSTDVSRFEVFDVSPLLADLKVEMQDHPPAPVYFFLTRVLARMRPVNVYAPPAASKYHDITTLAKAITGTAAALLTLALLINAPVALGVLDKRSQRDVLLARTLPLQSEHARLSQSFPETPLPSTEMQLVVESYASIKAQVHSPLDTLNVISRALASSPGLKITAVDWQMAEKVVAPVMDEFGGLPPTPAPLPGVDGTNEFMALVLQQKTELKVIISGEAYSADSPRNAQDQVVAFADALASSPGIAVFPAKLPTDVRTDASVSTTVTDGEVRAPFALELTLGGTLQ